MKFDFLKLTKSQTNRLSDFCLEIGTIGIASVVLPTILDTFKIIPMLSGLIITSFFWTLSINLIKD